MESNTFESTVCHSFFPPRLLFSSKTKIYKDVEREKKKENELRGFTSNIMATLPTFVEGYNPLLGLTQLLPH